MIEVGENVVCSVPRQHLVEFAKNLFCYLYMKFHMNHPDLRLKKFNLLFRVQIGDAVLLVERNACKFNNQVLDCCGFEVDRLIICQKICDAYPKSDYFKKLYHMTAFIFDLMLWWHRHMDTADLSEGPKLWIEIFEKNFESTFEGEGGWEGFFKAGQNLLYNVDKHGKMLPKFGLMPNYFWNFMSGLKALIPKYDEATDINMIEIVESVNSLTDPPDEVVDEPAIEHENIEEPEENPAEQVIENPAVQVIENTEVQVIENPAVPVIENPAVPVIENPAVQVIENPAVQVIENPAVQVIENPAEQDIENPGPPSAAVEDRSGGRNRRKRRHLAESSDSEPDMDRTGKIPKESSIV